MKTYDLICIGGGSAGFNAARTARALGKRVAIVDGARELGGLCILRGCMPSKTLLYSTDVLHLAQKGRTFGLRIPSAKVDMKALHRRKLRIIEEFAQYREKAMLGGAYTVLRSHARFIDPHTPSNSPTASGCAVEILSSAPDRARAYPGCPAWRKPRSGRATMSSISISFLRV